MVAKTSPLTDLIKRSFFEMMKDVATSIPGYVLAFDSETQMAQIQIGIVRKDVNGKDFTPPPLIEVPVYFPGGSEFFLEFQIDPKDEGVILFSQRCIDAWIDQGGVAPNPIMRFHDFSDAIFLPGLRSQPKKITAFQNNGIRMRNKTGSSYVWIKNDGKIYIKGDVIVEGDVEADGISLITHTHSNGNNGNPTGPPIP